jgi:hypothetical protein
VLHRAIKQALIQRLLAAAEDREGELSSQWVPPCNAAAALEVLMLAPVICFRPYGFFGATGVLPVGPIAVTCRITSPSLAHA